MTMVEMLAGPPGSGKSTYAQTQIQLYGALTLSLDNMRRAIWGSKKEYWIRRDKGDNGAATLLHRCYLNTLLEVLAAKPSFLVLDNTHSHQYQGTLDLLQWEFGITPELVVFNVDLAHLLIRNADRPIEDRLREEDVVSYYQKHISPDVWWREYQPRREYTL